MPLNKSSAVIPGLGLALILVLFMSLNQSYALQQDHKEPVHIQANHVFLDEKQGTSEYTGNVVFTQGSLILKGDKIIIYQPQGILESVLVYGDPASFEQQSDTQPEKVHALAEKMEYITEQQKVFLTTNASVWQGKDRLSGDYIEYDTIKSTVTASKEDDSDSRVRAIIEPNKK